jgi:hypothetical protein
MKIKTFRSGAHKSTVVTDHRGAAVKLKISNGFNEVEITLTPTQAGEIANSLVYEAEIAQAIQRNNARRDGVAVTTV